MPLLVLVTETEFRRAESTFTSTAGFDCRVAPRAEDALCDAVVQHGVRSVVVGSAPYRERLYTTLGPGGLIARFGVGYDNIDRARATAAGVLCTNTPDVLQQSVAELTMTMIGAAARHVRPGRRGAPGRTLDPEGGQRARGQDAGADWLRCDCAGRGSHRLGRLRYARGRLRPHRRGQRRRTLPRRRPTSARRCGAPISSACTFPRAAENARFLDQRPSLAAPAPCVADQHGPRRRRRRTGAVRGARFRAAGRRGARRLRTRALRAGRRRARPADAPERHPGASHRQQHGRGQPADGAARPPERAARTATATWRRWI